jgi:hypothetical protein
MMTKMRTAEYHEENLVPRLVIVVTFLWTVTILWYLSYIDVVVLVVAVVPSEEGFDVDVDDHDTVDIVAAIVVAVDVVVVGAVDVVVAVVATPLQRVATTAARKRAGPSQSWRCTLLLLWLLWLLFVWEE